MSKPLLVFLVSFLFVLMSCVQESPKTTQAKNENGSIDASQYLSLEYQFTLSPETAYQLGSEFVDFFYDPEDASLVLTERNSGVMAKIGKDDNLVWKLKTPTPAPRKILDFANGDRNPVTGHFLVYDRTQKKTFEIDADGNILSSFRPEPDFIDFGTLVDESIVYRTEGFHNTHVTGEDQAYAFMVYAKDGTLKSKMSPHSLPVSSTVFNDYDDFSRFDGRLYYQKQFSDTTFLVTEDSASFAYTARADNNDRAQQLLDDAELQSPYELIIQEEVPSVLKSVKGNKYRYERFGVHGSSKFLIRDASEKEVFRSNVLLVDGKYVSVPRLYNDGYYFSVMYQKQYDAFQSSSIMDKTLLPGLMPATDIDGLVVTVMKIK